MVLLTNKKKFFFIFNTQIINNEPGHQILSHVPEEMSVFFRFIF